ncbi:MAG TPA: sigma-70 family RNA polymerase sigma factor [Ktedonobacterales bacterium]
MLNVPKPQSLPGEVERLRSALLSDRDGLLTSTRQRLVRLARARGIPPHALDDVVQETLLEAWSHLNRLTAPAGFSSWIDAIARNVCRRATQRYAADRRHTLTTQEIAPPVSDGGDAFSEVPDSSLPDPVEELDRHDRVRLIDRALGELPPSARRLIDLCYLLDMPHSEVAARLDISRAALDTRLHRVRARLRALLSGPLRAEAEVLGLALDASVADGWQETRLWCPECGVRRLQGAFVSPEDGMEPNLHLRCPACAARFGRDTVHSMGLIALGGMKSFRPAWKRTMAGMAARMTAALAAGEHPCLWCGRAASLAVETSVREADSLPEGYWIAMRCGHCGNDLAAEGDIPAVDQLVYWSHPRTRDFLQAHPRVTSASVLPLDYHGAPAIRLDLASRDSGEHVTVVAHRKTLDVLMVE